jgi:hypothetical protein
VRQIQIHIADHYDEQGEEEMQRAALAAAGQGNHQMMQQANQNLLDEGGGGMQPTPASGALAAPQASAPQYAGREMANATTSVAVA